MNNQEPSISNGTEDMPSTESIQENPMNDIRDDDYFTGSHPDNDADETGANDEKEATSRHID